MPSPARQSSVAGNVRNAFVKQLKARCRDVYDFAPVWESSLTRGEGALWVNKWKIENVDIITETLKLLDIPI